MEQPKQTESPEKPVVKRRWLLFNQYKWAGSGTQREIRTCPYKCPYIWVARKALRERPLKFPLKLDRKPAIEVEREKPQLA